MNSILQAIGKKTIFKPKYLMIFLKKKKFWMGCRFLQSPIRSCHLAAEPMPVQGMSLLNWRCLFWSTIWSPNTGTIMTLYFIYNTNTFSDDKYNVLLKLKYLFFFNYFFGFWFFQMGSGRIQRRNTIQPISSSPWWTSRQVLQKSHHPGFFYH